MQKKEKKFVDVGALQKAEREKEQIKKKNLLREQLNDLDLINRKKEIENQRKKNYFMLLSFRGNLISDIIKCF